MDNESAETLLTMARLIDAKKASASEALQAAYRLGYLDGQIAQVVEDTPAAFGTRRP